MRQDALNVKPSNVLRPPVKEMMFDVVWSFTERAKLSSPIVFFNFCVFVFGAAEATQPAAIKFDIALPVWSHPAITFQKRNYSFSAAAQPSSSFLESSREIIIHGFGSWNWTHLLTFCANSSPQIIPFLE